MPPYQIIAAADEEVKILVGVIVAIIWGLAQVASWIKKPSAPSKPRPAGAFPKPPIKQAMPMRMAPMPQARPRQMAASALRPPPVPARRTQPAAKPTAAARTPRIMPPPLPSARRPQPAPAPPPVARAAPPRPAPPPPPAPAAAPATRSAGINRWLRPATLRRQFILTEIFQKPLALRSDD
ncbi:MAG TPA: hypothetical protein VH370_13355 [Humisphaera sp.]|jgi:hypothetical protein|nr:hypothetical protein [Humisphaera sp.]